MTGCFAYGILLINMNSILHRRIGLWASLLLIVIIGLVVGIQQPVGATNISASFTKFIGDESHNGPSDIQADGLYNQLFNKSSFQPCYNSASYPSDAVNGKDGGESFISLETWAAEGAADLNQDWQNKSNALITLINGTLSSGNNMTLEFSGSTDTSTGEEGWCSFIVRMATEAKIPITAGAVTVDNTSQKKSDEIGKISNNCSVAFGDASSGVIGLPSKVVAFLGSLGSNVYDAKVQPYVGTAAYGGAANNGCTQITEALADELKSGGATVACANLGYTTGAEKLACALGYNNGAASPDICKSTYGDNRVREHGIWENVDESKELAACNAGVKAIPESSITDPKTSCVVEGIGWIVCPIMGALGGLNDMMYGWVKSVLVLNPLSQTMKDDNGADVASPQYTNWAIMRNIANVLLAKSNLQNYTN